MQRNQIPQKLSDLREHKFKYTFQDTLNQFCLCGIDVETNMHFFLYCPFWYIIKDVPSWAQLLMLIVLWQILLLYTSLVNSVLIRYQTYPQTSSYLMEKWFFSTFYKKFSISQFLWYVNFFTFFCILTYFFKTIQFIFIWFLEMHLLFTNMFLHSIFCYHTCNRHCVFDTLRT